MREEIIMPRVSDYNIYLPLKKSSDYLLIQGAKGSFDIVEPRIVDTLKNFENKSELRNQIPQEDLDVLLRRGYITELTEEDEFEFIRKLSEAINSRGRKMINVTIIPTYNCNFRCEYCFERNLQKNAFEWLNEKISNEIVDAIFTQLVKYRESGLVVDGIYLFGGEPLLKANMEIVEYICKKAREMEVPIACISNGYDLDQYIDLIKKYNFKYVQITIDGIGEEHDKRRYLVGGQGTYNRIVSNISKALEQGVNIVLRSNINKKNTVEILRLMDFYRESGWLEKDNFSYYFKSTLKCYDEIGDAYSDVELMKELTKVYEDNIEKFRFNSIYNGLSDKLSNMLKNNTFAPMRSGYCGANMGMYTVDPFGDIYPCWDVLNDKDEVIGSVDISKGEFVFNESHDRWKERTVDKIDDCKKCKYMLFCGGGCSAQAKVMNNDINRAFCDDFQFIFNEVAVDVCEEFLSQII